MTVLLTVAHVPLSGAATATTSVVAAGLSGLELAGTVGGIAAAAGSLAALGLTVAASNRARRREFAADLDAAKAEGAEAAKDRLEPALEQAKERAEHAERDAEFWRQAYINRAGVVPGPGGEPQ